MTTAYISLRPGPRRSETSWYRRASPKRLRVVLLRSTIRNVAVCLLPGTELAFENEVRCETAFVLRSTLGHTVAKFQQVNKGRSDIHHDALEFPDGKIVLLTHLCKGQRATVLQLPARPRITVDDAQRYDLLAV